MSKPHVLEADGVRVVWGRHLTDPWADLDAGEITDAEFVLFNSLRLKRRLCEVGEDSVSHFFLFFSRPPYSKELVEQHLQAFLSVRRMLRSPTQAEAVDLLKHESELVREYARDHWSEWRNGWKPLAQ